MKQNAQMAERQIKVTLPDGSERKYAAGTTGMEVAQSIGAGLAKAAVAIRVDGQDWDLSRPIENDVKVAIIRRQDPEGLELIRHDCAHVLAEAVQELFPGTQVTIGPNIENGFYYDFARNNPFTTDDFAAIEKKMHDIVDRGAELAREVWGRDEAIKYFRGKGEYFKAELIEGLPGNEPITVYRQGEWLDLCRGPHMPTTKHVGHAFKLMKVAGAYWRGDASKQQLTRIYGTAWRDEKELAAYLTMLEEAEKRDHRKIGAAMDLFHFQEEAQGSVFWHPHGFTIYNQLENYVRRRIYDDGYVEVKTPQLIDNKLWEASGHWGKFRENMFVVPDETPSTEEGKPIFSGKFDKLLAIKPMNCPAHVQIFKQGIKSYRDLPLRMAEFGCCHRNEPHGALHGLMRVRQMTQDDAHIFCREDQITSEVKKFVELFYAVYKDFNFTEISIKLATRPAARAGNDAVWDKAEKAMADALQTLDLPFEYAPGEGAFYGPKYEFHLKDAIGRSWQCGTCQLDFVLPERLDATYIGEDSGKHRPVMIHRAVLGSMERFIGMLIESSGGKLPLWIAPVQCVVATITSDADGYAKKAQKMLRDVGIRADIDLRNEKINYKVREHMLAKVPVMFVVGKREAEEGKVAIRYLGDDRQPVEALDAALKTLAENCKPPY
ncbi:MAG: threonine--tRNA ligase [Proteobacteria bacterium]|nr:threonine--tRNA ligase [Pseudomonadota bacterium]